MSNQYYRQRELRKLERKISRAQYSKLRQHALNFGTGATFTFRFYNLSY